MVYSHIFGYLDIPLDTYLDTMITIYLAKKRRDPQWPRLRHLPGRQLQAQRVRDHLQRRLAAAVAATAAVRQQGRHLAMDTMGGGGVEGLRGFLQWFYWILWDFLVIYGMCMEITGDLIRFHGIWTTTIVI